MKMIFALILFVAVSMPSAFAETESPQAACKAEADESGFENKAEYNAYIEECVAQITSEANETEASKDIDVSMEVVKIEE